MRHAQVLGVAVILVGTAGDGRAVEKTVGDGIVVVDLSADDVGQLLRAVDGAAALADIASTGLPAEYQLIVRAASGGWRLARAVLPGPMPVRVVFTAVPPAMLLLPVRGTPATEVVRAYTEFRAKAGGMVAAPFREFANRVEALAHRVRP